MHVEPPIGIRYQAPAAFRSPREKVALYASTDPYLRNVVFQVVYLLLCFNLFR